MASEISVESVCQFISTHGGKVKNTTLVSNFKKYLNNPETKDIARQKFKECVNTVAVVKNENGEKYVQLKKKYRAPSMSSSVSSVNSETVSETVSTNDDPLTSHPTQDEPTSAAHDTSFTPQDEVPYADGVEDQEAPSRAAEPERDSPMHETYDNVVVERKVPMESVPPPEPEKEVAQLPPPRADAPAPKSSPVKISITEARGSVANQNEEKAAKRGHENLQRPSSSKPATGKPDSTGEFAVPVAPHRKKKERKENVPPSPVAEHRFAGSLERAKAGFASSTNEQGRLSRMRPISVVQPGYPGSVERARLNFQSKKSQNDETSSLALSEKSVDSKGEADDDYERSAPAICLDPSEKLWMIKSCQGNMVEMRKLLDGDPNLAVKKDFVLGYTSLHWAAKKGNIDMINMLLDQKVDINARSNGGYTPLHLAAIHGHEAAIAHLLEYEADPSIRDYSGRQPIHYLKTVSLPLQSKRSKFSKTASWRRHLHANGGENGHTVSEETYARMWGNDKRRKEGLTRWKAPETHSIDEPREAEPRPRPRADSTSSAEVSKAPATNHGKKSRKVSRTESVLAGMGLRRKQSHLKFRTPQESEPPAPVPSPVVRPSSAVQFSWKPAGPKNR